eukprot:TRINITY_DN7590_c0_g1_i3.p1 TRINITY_DN7590_c0_g1~~TRINITY_DN7590_c0_g1_i3.p1  ORF type:complete len:258 (-),score=22.47 TRINITY_DN7590_c0_g1_i3:116-889(-)
MGTMATTLPTPVEGSDEFDTPTWECATNDTYESVRNGPSKQHAAAGLSLVTSGDKPMFWGLGRRFGLTWFNESRYATKVEIESAGMAWNQACGVVFREAKIKKEAFFVIRDATADEEDEYKGRGFIALSFFPTQEPREVIIFKTYHSDDKLQDNRVAVLTHEFGHILGLRHEHIRNIDPQTLQEVEDTSEGGEGHEITDRGRVLRALYVTPFDKHSIMSYKKLRADINHGRVATLSFLDQTGAQMVYGQSPFRVQLI